MKFKFLEHTADIKVKVFGETLEEAFENSAYALKEIMTKDKIKIKIKKQIKAKGTDLKSLLYHFLEEFLILLDSEGFVLGKISSLKIDEKKREITAEIVGDLITNYETLTHVKAVTYNDMEIKQINKGYEIIIVFDV